MIKDKEIILNALQRERDELHDKIMQIDRIIRKVKGLADNDDQSIAIIQPVTAQKPKRPSEVFAKYGDVKLQILSIFDIVGKAAKLKEIQRMFNEITRKTYNIREIVRTLNRQRIILMCREKDSDRGMLWVKRDWVQHGVLLDQYKPEGFDVFYKAENLIYEQKEAGANV